MKLCITAIQLNMQVLLYWVGWTSQLIITYLEDINIVATSQYLVNIRIEI